MLFNTMDNAELAAQLRKPTGAISAQIGKRMARSNAKVISACIALLQIEAGNTVLEIGPGNGAHIASVIEAAEDVRYVGIDWSAAMVAEAKRRNQAFVKQGVVACFEDDAASMWFDAGRFDRVFSVNTIYFWEDPRQPLTEIRRVLKPGGIFCLAFGERQFMEKLPFTNEFTLYSSTDAVALLEHCDFTVLQHEQHTEEGLSNENEPVSKLFHIVRCAI